MNKINQLSLNEGIKISNSLMITENFQNETKGVIFDNKQVLKNIFDDIFYHLYSTQSVLYGVSKFPSYITNIIGYDIKSFQQIENKTFQCSLLDTLKCIDLDTNEILFEIKDNNLIFSISDYYQGKLILKFMKNENKKFDFLYYQIFDIEKREFISEKCDNIQFQGSYFLCEERLKTKGKKIYILDSNGNTVFTNKDRFNINERMLNCKTSYGNFIEMGNYYIQIQNGKYKIFDVFKFLKNEIFNIQLYYLSGEYLFGISYYNKNEKREKYAFFSLDGKQRYESLSDENNCFGNHYIFVNYDENNELKYQFLNKLTNEIDLNCIDKIHIDESSLLILKELGKYELINNDLKTIFQFNSSLIYEGKRYDFNSNSSILYFNKKEKGLLLKLYNYENNEIGIFYICNGIIKNFKKDILKVQKENDIIIVLFKCGTIKTFKLEEISSLSYY